MENEIKRYYSRCMYGNYKPDFADFENKASFSRFKAFWLKVNQETVKALKRLKLAVSVVLVGAILLFSLDGCKTQHTVIKEETVTRYVDSTIWHTDTNFFEIPVEIYRDYTGLLDTLRLENKYSIVWSAVDTNNMILLGELKSKNVKVPVEYKWKERIIYQDTTIFKEKEIPVPYPVVEEKRYIPNFAWICIVWAAISIVLLGLWLYVKFWKP